MIICLVYTQVHQPYMQEVDPLLYNILHLTVNILVTFVKKVTITAMFLQ